MLGACGALNHAPRDEWPRFRDERRYFRVYPLQAPALCMPLHSRYMRRSRSAVVSSELLRWYVILVTPFFFAPSCGLDAERLAMALSGVASRARAMQAVRSAVKGARPRRRRVGDGSMVRSFCVLMEVGIVPRAKMALYARNPAVPGRHVQSRGFAWCKTHAGGPSSFRRK
jgi:hypothetical protein